jgi:hypothetical protein
MSYPFSEHAERLLILAEKVFNFYAWAYAGDCSKVLVILSQSMQKGDIRVMPETAQKYDLSSSEHAERLILAETGFNFYALAYAGACSKLWVILSQSMQKGWY